MSSNVSGSAHRLEAARSDENVFMPCSARNRLHLVSGLVRAQCEVDVVGHRVANTYVRYISVYSGDDEVESMSE